MPTSFPTLTPDDVHVWQLHLDQPAQQTDRLAALLAPDEQERAARFRFDHHRRDYVIGRGVLRLLLGRYLNMPPATLRFYYGDKGKPALAPEGSAVPLQFNLAHSGRLALYAFSQRQPVGVDVEQVRELEDADKIARRFFSTAEVKSWSQIPPEQQMIAFFNCWTRKEAYIKAIGTGLALALDKFDVSLAPGEPARLLAIEGDPQKAAGWSLQELTVPAGYAAALVVAGRHNWQLSTYQVGAFRETPLQIMTLPGVQWPD